MIGFKSLVVLPAVSLFLMGCEKKEPSVSAQAPGVHSDDSEEIATAEASPGFSSELTGVAEHLDTNGVHFSITHIDKDLSNMAGMLDQVLDSARQSNASIPPNLHVKKLLDQLGLSEISAVGRSSRKTREGWHNRFYLQTGGHRAGLLSVLGEQGAPWRGPQLAPKDADLVIEFELNLRRLQQAMKPIVSAFGEEPERGFMDAMREKVGAGALTVGDMVGKMQLHATMVVSLDDRKRWKAKGSVELPGVDAALCIERGVWFWAQFGEMIEANAEVTEEGGLRFVRAPEEMDTPLGKLRPLLIIDKENDLIWVAMRESYLEHCRSGNDPLSKDAAYRLATSGFPSDGNALVYISSEFCNELDLLMKGVKEELPQDDESAVVFGLVEAVLGEALSGSSSGYAWSLANTKDGILSVANSPFPDKGYSYTNSIAPVAALAAMATPVIMKQQKKAQTVQAASNMKQIFMLLVEYDQDYEAFPKNLDELVKKGLIKRESLELISKCKINGRMVELSYIPGYSTESHSKTIIMHTPSPIDGKRAFLRRDGAAYVVPEAEFQELLQDQKK